MFLVMYQEIRLLNQGARFLDEEERIQFLISSVSETDWKRSHRLEFKMVSNCFYIPNANVCSPFCSSAGTVWTKIPMGGHAKFPARRLEEYQRTLRMMCGRVALSVQENQLTQDLELLIHDKKHVGIEIKFYNLDTFKKQVDAKLYRSWKWICGFEL